MKKRFLDLHVHSKQSTGHDSREHLKSHAEALGVSLSFCDGASPEDGLFSVIRERSDLNRLDKNCAYHIFEPITNDAFLAALRHGPSIFKTRLTPVHAKLLAKKGSALEISLSTIIGVHGPRRVRALAEINQNIMFARKFHVPLIATSGAGSIMGLRSPYQVFELLRILGLSEAETHAAMFQTPDQILQFGRDKAKNKVISREVRLV